MIVRADLPPGLQTAQAVHAAVAYVQEFPDRSAEWHDTSNNVVVLTKPDEVSLSALGYQLSAATDVAWFTEPDLDDQLTAVAAIGQDARRICSNLPLLGRAVT